MIWRDWYTHDVVNATHGGPTTLSAPLSHINVHIRDGSAILLHAKPAYTIQETREGPYSLLVSQSSDGLAFGSAYIDDGVSFPPGPSKNLTFSATRGEVRITTKGTFDVKQKLQDITILGVSSKPGQVLLNGKKVVGWQYGAGQSKLLLMGLNITLNKPASLTWK